VVDGGTRRRRRPWVVHKTNAFRHRPGLKTILGQRQAGRILIVPQTIALRDGQDFTRATMVEAVP
jgi:hypothetical protein